jgi:hypothetical protein
MASAYDDKAYYRDEDAWYDHYRPVSPEETQEILAPLVEHLQGYDAARQRLEQLGGRAADIGQLASILSAPLQLTDGQRSGQVALAGPRELSSTLRTFRLSEVQLQVRRRRSGLPVFYLCRLQRDYWVDYGLVVEDLYLSPDYPMADERFVKLRGWGAHERYFLRLSPLRAALRADCLSRGLPASGAEIDRILLRAGSQVLQAAWHEDQRPALLAARHLGLQQFQAATELLYTVNSSELCDLRSAADEEIRRFFVSVYPQPALEALLALLPSLPGDALHRLSETALSGYAQLRGAFGRLLRTPVTLAGNDAPLYRLIFGNLFRIDRVASVLAGQPALTAAVTALERNAGAVIERVLGK